MNVLMINTAKDRGGAARIATTLALDFNRPREKIRTQLIHFGDRRIDENFIGLRSQWVEYLIAAQTRLLGSYRIHDFGVHKKIASYAQAADLVHLHNLHGYYVNYRKLIDKIGHKPIVWTWHDMWPATGRCGQSGECDRWQTACAPCPHTNLYPAAWRDNSKDEYTEKFELFAALPNLRIVCPSQWLANIARIRGYDADRIVVIPNPVDTETFRHRDQNQSRSELRLEQGIRIALFIAANCNDPHKGYEDFCAATLDNDCLAIAIGENPDRPAAHVMHIGRISDQDTLALYYNAADVMLIPSYAENFPNTVVESLVCGTPVIGYGVGGIPLQLTDTHSVVISRGNIDGLRRALTVYLKNSQAVRASRAELADASAQRWSKQAVAARYLTLYREITT